jgi:hypothetical protein
MNTITNKYGVELTHDEVEKLANKLIGDCFKILGIYEGRHPITKEVVFSEEDAYLNFIKYIEILTLEVWGAYNIFRGNDYFYKLSNKLEGLKQVKIGQHKKVKTIVFQCTSICSKFKEV